MRVKRRCLLWLLGALVVLCGSLFAGVSIGSVSVSVSDPIVHNLRIPRVLLGCASGAGLAVAGVILQAIVRNVLADPYIVGVHSGASCGTAAAILFGVGSGVGLQAMAFLGAVGATVLVFLLARSGGQLTAVRLLLSGVAIGYALSALTSFMIFASDSPEASRSVMFWLLGSLSLASWGSQLAAVFVVFGVVSCVVMLLAPHIDALCLGDTTALSLGVHLQRLRAVLLLATCLLIGSVVSLSGAIGFVGLVVPHLARRVVGASHRVVIPMAALLGAILVIWADIGARTILSPQELPIGIITALVGTPLLLVLIRRHPAPTES
ncbi:iron chelate uptake ABC transporter family permease subunit [Corynebacterium sp. 4HC-13]|uniref:FecCD family ABC transporter permease n=1 Tax=Corynebacterium anserum TaxID=2684406 RepID=UPI001639AE12|nr:iron ABC transporter permease [Corynebacterium anserum]MBC2682335.1 iron chelate uptake ABC transporter family permease subunit [Corynebacterium anserum]